MANKKKEQQRLNDSTALVKLLSERGIELELWGCGCCGSPTLKVKVDGKLIFEDKDVHLP